MCRIIQTFKTCLWCQKAHKIKRLSMSNIVDLYYNQQWFMSLYAKFISFLFIIIVDHCFKSSSNNRCKSPVRYWRCLSILYFICTIMRLSVVLWPKKTFPVSFCVRNFYCYIFTFIVCYFASRSRIFHSIIQARHHLCRLRAAKF